MGSIVEAYDNAMAESFFATLACERLERRTFRTPAEAQVIFEFIEGRYNSYRKKGDQQRHRWRKSLKDKVGDGISNHR